MAEAAQCCSYSVTEEELIIISAVKTAYENDVAGGFEGTPLEWFVSITNPSIA